MEEFKVTWTGMLMRGGCKIYLLESLDGKIKRTLSEREARLFEEIVAGLSIE
jgi:hypothetical protein